MKKKKLSPKLQELKDALTQIAMASVAVTGSWWLYGYVARTALPMLPVFGFWPWVAALMCLELAVYYCVPGLRRE